MSTESVRIASEYYDLAKALAAHEDRSISKIIGRALAHYDAAFPAPRKAPVAKIKR